MTREEKLKKLDEWEWERSLVGTSMADNNPPNYSKEWKDAIYAAERVLYEKILQAKKELGLNKQ